MRMIAEKNLEKGLLTVNLARSLLFNLLAIERMKSMTGDDPLSSRSVSFTMARDENL